MDDKLYLIEAVRDELQAELDRIVQVDKPNLARASASVRQEVEPEDQASDEYIGEQLDVLQQREAEIRDILDRAEIVATPVSKDAVSIGSTVTIEDAAGRRRYTLVGSVGADPARGWITTESPLGASLLGKRPGGKVTFEAPGGRQTVAIIAIE